MTTRTRRELTRTIARLGLLTAVLLATSGSARAEATLLQAVHAARLSLSEYALSSGTTLRTLEQLAPYARPADILREVSTQEELLREEARYLRAALVMDLLVVSVITPEQVDRTTIAAAYGTPRATLLSQVRADLEGLQATRFGVPATAALGELELLEKSERQGFQLRAARGIRSELLLAGRVVHALKAGRADALEVLATLGRDPCANQEPCPEPFVHFDAAGRRAMWALREAGGALTRAAEAARRGDPLAQALSLEVTLYLQQLREVVLVPRYKLSPGLDVIQVEQGLGGATPDAVVILNEASLEVGFLPRVRLDAAGELELWAAGTPVLPTMERVALPTAYQAYVRPVPEATEALRGIFSPERAVTVAVGVLEGVPAHVLARVVLTLVALGQPDALLLARERDGGTVETLAMPVVRSSSTEGMATSLRVRLGGFSLKDRGNLTDIPRLHTADGLRFDLPSLEQRLGPAVTGPVALSFMADVASDVLMAAAVRVAAVSKRVELRIP